MDDIQRILDEGEEYLKSNGITVPDLLKRRDRREPGRVDKLRMEDKLFGMFRRHFKGQISAVVSRLQWQTGRKSITEWYSALPIIPAHYEEYQTHWDKRGIRRKRTYTEKRLVEARKDMGDITGIFDQDDDEFTATLIRVITAGAYGGIRLFQEQVRIGFDYTMTNEKAAKWANQHSGELIKDIDKFSKEVVTRAIEDFINTPGMTMKDLENRLSGFGDRANRIAVTETTRAYAQGWRQAGHDLQKEYPDVKVVKTWFTNEDDIVCDICGPLSGTTIDIDEDFEGTDEGDPPAHVNCRCWINAGTDILG